MPPNIGPAAIAFATADFAIPALVATNSAIFVCVNNCVTDINANSKPEYFITCWDRFPSGPPVIDTAPARDVNANVPAIRPLFIESSLCAEVFLAFTSISIASLVLLLIADCSAAPRAPISLRICSGVPPRLCEILLVPLLTPPTAAVPNACPEAATSSCWLAIPTSRPLAISCPVLIVSFDGDAVFAPFAIPAVADLPTSSPAIPASSASWSNAIVKALASSLRARSLSCASEPSCPQIFFKDVMLILDIADISGPILNAAIIFSLNFATPASTWAKDCRSFCGSYTLLPTVS